MHAKRKKAFPGSTRNFPKGINPLGDATANTLPRNRYVWILERLGGWKWKYVKENPTFVFLAADFG